MHPRPFNDRIRLEVLAGYRVLDTAAEPCFDRIVEVAKNALDCPVAAISLVDDMRQWFKARSGVELCETSRDVAFCAHTIMSAQALVIPDATRDPRFRDNPLVTGEASIRFYVGVPIVSPAGFCIGAVCVIDSVAKAEPAAAKVAILHELAAMVADLLELRRHASDSGVGAAKAAARPSAAAPINEADAAARAKSEFLALIGHELRTPLNAIMGFGGLIDAEVGDDALSDYAKEVCRSGEHLLSLIDRIMEFGQAERGELGLREEAVDLSAVVEEVGAAMTGLAGQSGATLLTTVPRELPMIRGDVVQLRQVLMNLIGNSIKAEAKTVSVEVESRPQGGLRLSVVDDGCGIDPVALDRVMERFSIGEDVLRRRDEGLGLGLPLTMRLVELHGGTLSLASDGVGRGARAEVTIPVGRMLEVVAA